MTKGFLCGCSCLFVGFVFRSLMPGLCMQCATWLRTSSFKKPGAAWSWEVFGYVLAPTCTPELGDASTSVSVLLFSRYRTSFVWFFQKALNNVSCFLKILRKAVIIVVQLAMSWYLFINGVLSRKSEAWISAGKQRSEASCLSLRLYFTARL